MHSYPDNGFRNNSGGTISFWLCMGDCPVRFIA